MSAPGPWLNITTNDGVLLERIDLSEFDLSRPFARATLMAEIQQAVMKAVRDERQNDETGGAS